VYGRPSSQQNIMGSDKQELLLESLRVLKKGGVFAINDCMKPKMYGDMEAFAQKLRGMGYQDVRLVNMAEVWIKGDVFRRKICLTLIFLWERKIITCLKWRKNTYFMKRCEK